MGKTQKLLFAAIIVLAAFFRLYRLDSVPPSVSLDEASIAYNSYSILKTGRDEYGTRFPMVLRAYDDYRPVLYAYLTVPFTAVFGLSPWAVRLPSALLSLVSVAVVFFLVTETAAFLKPGKFTDTYGRIGPYAAMAFLAVSPWHVYLSRLGHEANAGLAFTILGVYAFLRAVNRDMAVRPLYAAAACFGLAFCSYQSEKIIIPVMVAMFAVLFWRELLRHPRRLAGPLALGIVTVLPVVLVTLSPTGMMRFAGTNAWTYSPEMETAKVNYERARASGNTAGRIINSPRFVAARIVARNYLYHFDPKWLVTGGIHQNHKVPGMGLLYPWEALLALAGLGAVFFHTKDRRLWGILGVWFLSAPLPASITTQAPHAMRSMTFLPVYQLLAAAGAAYLTGFSANRIRRVSGLAVLAVCVLLSGIWLAGQYFGVFPRTESGSFQYALGQALRDAIPDEKGYRSVVVSSRKNLTQSYMFYLYYAKYDPAAYLENGGTKSGSFDAYHKIGKWEFRDVNWKEDRMIPGVRLLANPEEFPDHLRDTGFRNLDGTIGVVANER